MKLRLPVFLFLSLVSVLGPLNAHAASLSWDRFVNPIGEGADPWVVRDPNQDRYLWCFSEGNRGIAIHASSRLTSFGRKQVVWRAPDQGPVSREVWAPELHFLDGKWHVYFAASDGRNENHLAYVLQSEGVDPFGRYELHGPLPTGEGDEGRSPNVWAIDMTVLEREGKRYAIWSGWDAPGTDRQYLYIDLMKSPTELRGQRVRLCANDDHDWERVELKPGARGLNEGPQVFQSGTRTFVTYSCGASWLPTYKLGLLELKGSNPLDPNDWVKLPEPVFSGTEQTFGVGHSCFVPSPDKSEWWHVFHAKRDRTPGWRRVVFVQPMRIDENGMPLFDKPAEWTQTLVRPSGEKVPRLPLPYFVSLKSDGDLEGWSYFGHHQSYRVSEDGLHLGRVARNPINHYRSGEKMMLDRVLASDLSVEVMIDFRGDASAGDAGILFRSTGASVGYDAQRGYFAGLIPKTGLVILGRTDGRRWEEIARAPAQFDVDTPQRLGVDVAGDRIRVSLGGKELLSATDGTYAFGTVGLRVVDAQAVFSGLSVRPAPEEK